MCHIGVSDEGRSSSMVIGLSNDCKGVFNGVSLTPWCHTVVHFEVNMSRFFNQDQENHKDPPRS